MNRKLVAGIIILIVLSALFFKVRSGLPIARAEGQTLTWQDYSKHRSGLIRFRDLNKEKVSDDDIEKGVIFSFAEDSVIKKELEKRGKREDDVRRVVSENVDAEQLRELEGATSQLYGWTIADFEEYVLLPQARRALLMEEIEDEGIDPAEWLDKSLGEANISIYLLGWKWSSKEVKERF